MKKLIGFFVAAFAVSCIAAPYLFARGGGGGGGGGGARAGGGGGGGAARSPAASRRAPAARPAAPRPATPAATRPSTARPAAAPPKVASTPRPATGTAPRPATGAVGATKPGTAKPGTGAATRPSNSQVQNFLDVKPGAGASTLPANRPGAAVAAGAAGGAAANFLHDSGPRPSTQPARPGAVERPAAAARAAQNVNSRPDRIANSQERTANRTERRDEIGNQVRENNPRLDFWADHPNWAQMRINRPYRWATWAAVTGWVGSGWTDSNAYSYGENVYYDEGQVYYGDQPVASAEEYAQQAEDIATSAPDVAADKAEWMPLGVFALTPDGQKSGPNPTLFVQLAISKEGIISGLLNNTATNSTQEIEGMADKASQRAAWTVKGKSRPLMETGISNLTENTAAALIHFDGGETQQWLMVRLDEPAMK